MPHFDADAADGRVVRWLKSIGDRVERGEPIAEIETDKAVVDLESPVGGNLAEIVHREGAVVPVGEPVAWIDAVG
jgi:pyruvate/2-oxoglutarate dehydrogenase complex dihydrolipoamide acyltransferase (E2) component